MRLLPPSSTAAWLALCTILAGSPAPALATPTTTADPEVQTAVAKEVRMLRPPVLARRPGEPLERPAWLDYSTEEMMNYIRMRGEQARAAAEICPANYYSCESQGSQFDNICCPFDQVCSLGTDDKPACCPAE